jgi:hypothetical protein
MQNPRPTASGNESSATDQRRTGPATGNQRGNDLPSDGGTQKDGRRLEDGGAAPGTQHAAPGQQDPRDLKERKDDAQAMPGRQAGPAKRGQPSDTSETTAGQQGSDANDGGQPL